VGIKRILDTACKNVYTYWIMRSNVHCEIWDDDDLIKVYRGDLFIAVVTDIYGSGDPVISFVNEDKEINKLSFNDFAIISDNWEQMIALKK